ncbi:unnamed protein product [Amoebophrya sp. A25]|nr:unnamed protein product [Amoebophrya sp. A25]|eukprot:GSA25T00022070001.1
MMSTSAMIRFALFGLAGTATALNVKNVALRTTKIVTDGQGKESSYIATSLKFTTTLRVCNAYPFAEATQVLSLNLPYKTCGEIANTALGQGQQIDFYANEKKVLLGSFEVQDTPREDSTLLLVLQPLDSESTGVSFQSHAYANSGDAQVALLDAFIPQNEKAVAHVDSLVDIKDAYGAHPRDEKLRLNSVVAVNSGYYSVGLLSTGSSAKALHALDGEKISIIRVGVAGSKNYGEDLIVFPDSSRSIFSTMVSWVRSIV